MMDQFGLQQVKFSNSWLAPSYESLYMIANPEQQLVVVWVRWKWEKWVLLCSLLRGSSVEILMGLLVLPRAEFQSFCRAHTPCTIKYWPSFRVSSVTLKTANLRICSRVKRVKESDSTWAVTARFFWLADRKRGRIKLW